MSALEAGQIFERYRIIRELGSGVSGESYEAEDIVLLRKVTLKLIHPWMTLSDASRRQFFREMQGISILNHPYIASMLDYGEINGKLYVARRYVSSGSLLGNEGRLWFHPPLSIPDAIHYGHQLAQALEYIHKHGYLHGSLSFANILVLRGPNLDNELDYAPFLLADVGLANFVRRFGEPQLKLLPVTAAPEQLGQRVTQASDQFALAALIYLWLTGRPAYLGTPEEIEHLKLTETIKPLISLNSRTTIEQDVVLRRALAVYPEDRYPSVLAFADALLATLPHQAQADTVIEPTIQLAVITQTEPHEIQEEEKTAPAVEPELIGPTESASITEPEIVPQTEAIATSESEHEAELTPQASPDVPQPTSDIPQPVPTFDVPEPTALDVSQQIPEPVPQIVADVSQLLPEPDVTQTSPETAGQSEPLAEEELPVHQELVSLTQDQELPPAVQDQGLPSRMEEAETSPLTRLVIISPYTEEPYEVLVERDEITIGRAGSSDLLLDHDNSTSRHHALLKREGDRFVIYDRRSVNGVFVNGQMLMGEIGYVLEDGDHVSIGNYELIFRCKRPEVADEAEQVTSQAASPETVVSWSFF